jgi:hypothetical protein
MEGRLSFRVYNANKPIKYGIKSYVLCDSANAYCCSLDVYATEGMTLEQTVRRLLGDSCLKKWHSLYMDNFYNSVELSESLLADNVHTVGTMRINRGEGEDVRTAGNKQHHLERGETVARGNGKVMTICWMDKKPVRVLSTKHDGSMIEIERMKKGGHGQREKIMKPECICEYNQYMSGVDRLDQTISYYPCTRKSYKWWKKLLLYLFEISIHNAHVLYNMRGSKMTLYDFRFRIVKNFCKVDNAAECFSEDSDYEENPQPAFRSPVHDPSTRLIGGFKRHHIELIPGSTIGQKPQKRCRLCYRAGVRKDTRYHCKECNVPFCLEKCFTGYHSMTNV